MSIDFTFFMTSGKICINIHRGQSVVLSNLPIDPLYKSGSNHVKNMKLCGIIR